MDGMTVEKPPDYLKKITPADVILPSLGFYLDRQSGFLYSFFA
jgi:hypothetical protein